MLNRKYIIVLIFLLFTNCVKYDYAQGNDLRLNNWLTGWYLLGPIQLTEGSNEVQHLEGFENDIPSVIKYEDNQPIGIGKIEYLNDSNFTWTKYESPDSIINLDEAVSKKSYVAAYAYTEVNAEEEGTYLFALGTNDGGRLWVNGIEIWDFPGARGLVPDDDLIPIFIKKGTNKILLKVEERGNNWGFTARIIPFNIDSFTKSVQLFNVISLPTGETELRSSLSDQVVDKLFSSVNLDIYSNDGYQKLIWSGEWSRNRKMKLNIPIHGFKPHLLKIAAERTDGKIWKNEILFYSGKRIEYTLFENGKTDYQIIIGEDASESEQWAAAELQKYLLEISGTSFNIVNDQSSTTEHEIIVGYNKHTEILLKDDSKLSDLSNESFVIKNVKSNLILAGGKQRGAMYAVFSFLEKQFGIRWYTPSVTSIPKRDSYLFSYLHHQESPSIQVRNDFYYEAFDPIWAAHNKINGAMGFREQHGGIEGYWAVHTFYRFMPPTEFFDEHPEYYSLIDEERVHDKAQLCLTNKDVLNIVTERLKKVMRENPANLIYSVSQNDWRNPCQCSNCQRIVNQEEGQAGIMVWFVNQVADKIKDEFPNKYVGTLAYQYTRKPPKNIKPNENVVIRLCSIECCFAHDFKSCPENQEFLSDLEGWSSISPHLYIWDYVVNFSHYIMPYPNFEVLQQNILTFRDNKSIGIMEQGAYQSRGGEFAELRAYVISKLLWNTECDVNDVIDDFMFGYYGRSGQYIKEYLNLLHNQITHETHIHLGLKPDDKIFNKEFIKEADILFDKAVIVAENDKIKKRVELARISPIILRNRVN